MSRLATILETARRPVLRTAAGLLLQAAALTCSLGLPARAETGTVVAGPDMTCAEFSTMDADGQMQAMAAMAAGDMAAEGGAMASDNSATGAMTSEEPATGAMADTDMMASHEDLMATIDACAGHADMMAVDAMHQAVTH
jgi:hypothetical protein